MEYHFYPVTAGQIQFRIKAANDAHVALTTGPQEGDPMYEVRFRTYATFIIKNALSNGGYPFEP